jgi:raffinose/stachyose/melibiose transport system permease protein
MTATNLAKSAGLVKLDTKAPRRPFRLSAKTVAAYAILLILTAVYLGPLAMLVNTSFMTQRQFNRNATSIPETFQLENFAEAWEQANFSQYLTNTAFYAAAATTIYVLTAVLLAFPIARGYIRGGKLIFLLFVIALFLPPALIPQFQLILNLGLYNTQMGYIMLLVTNPVGIIILVNYLKSLPKELDEAAAMDGCGYGRFLLTIVFPLSRPVIATVVVLHAIGIWNELILATIYLTNREFYPITRGMIVFQGVYGFNWPVLAAGVVLMAIPMVILFLFLQRYIISGITAGAVKE